MKPDSTPPEKACPDERCPVKGLQLLSAFPRNSKRPDGHHLYCKACCNRRVHEGRVRQRTRRASVRKKRPDCNERVWLAISVDGARTQKEIKRVAQVSTKDELGLALTELMLNREWVKSALAGEERIYFPNPALQAT